MILVMQKATNAHKHKATCVSSEKPTRQLEVWFLILILITKWLVLNVQTPKYPLYQHVRNHTKLNFFCKIKKTSTTHRISSFQFVDAQCTRLRYKNVINVPKSSLSERNNQPPNQKYHLFSTFSTLAQSALDNCLNISYPPNIKPSQIVLLTNSAYVNHYKEDKSYENV